MNILPKKRWHVRTKENIARVRSDEAKAAEEEKERVQRAKLAEQEARTQFLRSRARGQIFEGASEQKTDNITANDTTDNVAADIYTDQGNINFFKSLETGKNNIGTNKEYEEEQKIEKEKYEKGIGLLTYLGQDSLEATKGKAWYEDEGCSFSLKKGNDEVGLKSKKSIDPLNDIVKYTDCRPQKSKTSSLVISSNVSTDFKLQSKLKELDDIPIFKKKHKKHRCKEKRKHSKSSEKDSKHKHKKKQKKKKNESEEDMSNSDKEAKWKQLEILRQKRLQREALERKRAERLLEGKNPDVDEVEKTSNIQQKFNSQYNPHLARQNQENKGLQSGIKYWLS